MGGGAMRTAAKAAALSGYRSVASSSSRAGTPAPAGGRTLRTPSAAVSSAASAVEAVRPISIASSDKGLQEVAPLSAVKKPSWELDDWEFAEAGEEAIDFAPQYQVPRLVFGHVPTLAEAREAASDLKDALDAVYPSSVGSTEEAAHESTHRIPSAIISSIPGSVGQAFLLLQEHPGVQNVVADLAADKNVLVAVMKNEKFLEFSRTHTSILPPESDVTSEDVPAADVDDDSTNAEATEGFTLAGLARDVKAKVVEVGTGLSESARNVKAKVVEVGTGLSESARNVKAKVVEVGTGLSKSARNVKAKVVGVVTRFSYFIQDFFSSLTGYSKINDEAGKPSCGRFLGQALLALAVATILVVLVKRRKID